MMGKLLNIGLLVVSSLAPAAGYLPAGIVRPAVCATRTAGRCVAPRMQLGDGDNNADGWSNEDDARLADYIAKQSAARCGRPELVLNGLKAAWVLIFNLGRQTEGIYTLQGGRARSNSAAVLAFEGMYDVDRYARLLQAEGFDLATPIRWDSRQLGNFCYENDFDVSLVPLNGLITPPAKNEYDQEAFDRLEKADAFEGVRRQSGARDGADPPALDDASAATRDALERLFREGPPPL